MTASKFCGAAPRIAAFVMCLLLATAASLVRAADTAPLPPADLGQTNILDGEGGPGTLLEIITFGYGADRLAGPDGRSAPGSNEQQIEGAIVHPIWVSCASIIGAYPGVEVLLPVSQIRNDFAAGGAGSDTGLGDMTIAPFLQWSPPHPGAGSVSVRLAFQMVTPTGHFDATDAVDAGHGGWQLSPYLAATWRVTERWELSARGIYDWSSSVDGQTLDGVFARLRAGDFFVLNASGSYSVSVNLRLGIGGYLLQQLRASTLNSMSTPDRRQQVYAIGPVTQLKIGAITILGAAYQELDAQNRPEGLSVNVRLQQPF